MAGSTKTVTSVAFMLETATITDTWLFQDSSKVQATMKHYLPRTPHTAPFQTLAAWRATTACKWVDATKNPAGNTLRGLLFPVTKPVAASQKQPLKHLTTTSHKLLLPRPLIIEPPPDPVHDGLREFVVYHAFLDGFLTSGLAVGHIVPNALQKDVFPLLPICPLQKPHSELHCGVCFSDCLTTARIIDYGIFIALISRKSIL